MKLKEEILFEKYDQDEIGKLKPLTDRKILEAMEEYSNEKLINFILNSTRCGSRFEAKRLAERFNEIIKIEEVKS